MSKKKTLQESDSKQYLVVTREGKKYLAFLRDEEKNALVSQGATVEDPATGQNNTSSIMGEEQVRGDFFTLGMKLGKALAAALRDHGDSIEGLFLKNSTKNGCTLRVCYRPDGDGTRWEDEFVIEYSGDPDAKAYLVNGGDRIELCAITQQSGSAQINKDLAKAAFTNFINRKTDIGKSDIKASDPDVTGGQPISESEGSEMLWEENGAEQFCEAAKSYYAKKSKEGLKSLFKAARNFKKGSSIEEKLAGAVAWYKDPANRVSVGDKKKYYKNSKKQVFSGNGFEDMSGVSGMGGSGDASAAVEESMPKANIDPVFDSEGFEIYKDFLIPVTACLEKLKAHINKTEDTWVGSYYATIYRAVENLSNFVQKYDKPESLDEVGLRSKSECLSVDMPLFIRLLEYAKEDAKSDVDLHMVAENLQTICNEGGCADMSDYNKIVPEEAGEDSEEKKPLSEAKVIENYSELFKKFLNNFELKELAETWEKIYPEHYNALKDTVLYPYANIIEHILIMKGIISTVDGKIVNRPWEEEEGDDYRGADIDENLNEAVDGIPEEDIAEAFKAFREVEQQGYQDPWFRGHAPGKVDLTCIAYNGDYKFIWDVPAEMDEEEVVTSTGKIYELDITFPNGKTINMNESSLEKRNFYNEEELA